MLKNRSFQLLFALVFASVFSAGCGSTPTERPSDPDEVITPAVGVEDKSQSTPSDANIKLVPASETDRSAAPLPETEVGDLTNTPLSTVKEPVVIPSGHDQSTAMDPNPAQITLVPAKGGHSHKEKSHDHAATKAAGVEPSTALRWLKNGNIRFTKGSLRNDGQSRKDVSRLSQGQRPHTIVLSCSDSRVPPELVFDQKLGEIFVVRTAGQSLDSSGIASIEYAVSHLGARLIVVMGHTSCGAVQAAVETRGGSDAGSVHLNNLVKDIQPRLASLQSATPSRGFVSEGWANARGAAQDLMAKSVIVSDAVQKGQIRIVNALYNLSSGEVDFE